MRQQRENMERLNGAGKQIAARIDLVYTMHFHSETQMLCMRMSNSNVQVETEYKFQST